MKTVGKKKRSSACGTWRVRLFVAAALATSVGLAAPSITLSRYGFASASGTAPNGHHYATGWTVGIPYGGHASAGTLGNNVDLYAEFWSALFKASAPPAPNVLLPVPILGSTTGSWEEDTFTVTISGTKPPFPLDHNYDSWVYAERDDGPVAFTNISQIFNQNPWFLTINLQTNESVKLSFVCSNTFSDIYGLASPTILYIDQVPEPVWLGTITLVALAIIRRHTKRS